MTKKELSIRLADEVGITTQLATECVEGLMKVMADCFTAGHNIYLRGFGTYKVRTAKPKKARNISTGATVMIPARKNVKFIPCENLKERLHEG